MGSIDLGLDDDLEELVRGHIKYLQFDREDTPENVATGAVAYSILLAGLVIESSLDRLGDAVMDLRNLIALPPQERSRVGEAHGWI